MLTGTVPTVWEAIDKATLASAVWGIFSMHVAPDVALVALRTQARDWFLAQERQDDLLAAYDRFLLHWNPVFTD